jgi:hypothetical protein
MTTPVLADVGRPRASFGARGPLSASLLEIFAAPPAGGAPHFPALAEDVLADVADPLRDDDVQLTLFLLYAGHYGSLSFIDPAWEWSTDLISARAALERRFEDTLRRDIPVPHLPPADAEAVAAALFAMAAPVPGPSLSRHVAKKATADQLTEFLIHRSVYTLREADPHSWAIPRLSGAAKAALVEIQSDEYGAGDLPRMHAEIFARTLRGAGLDDDYGRYIDSVPALTLASMNLMSMFGLNRRLLGAVVGHLAAFEMTSSLPNRLYADGFRRLGFGPDVTQYFDEHVEADAVHEQIAGRDLAGGLAEDRPELLRDIFFGAAACLAVDGWVADSILAAWQRGASSLRAPAGMNGEAPPDGIAHTSRGSNRP